MVSEMKRVKEKITWNLQRKSDKIDAEFCVQSLWRAQATPETLPGNRGNLCGMRDWFEWKSDVRE